MALEIGYGGRTRVLDALAGRATTATSMYLSLYFAKDSGGTAISMGPTSTLTSLAPWEILPVSGGGNLYTRQLITGASGMGAVVPSTLYHEVVNGGEINFGPTTGLATALAQTVSVSNPVNHAVISLRSNTNSTEPADIIAFGQLLSPISVFNGGPTGDTIRFLPGELKIRQG